MIRYDSEAIDAPLRRHGRNRFPSRCGVFPRKKHGGFDRRPRRFRNATNTSHRSFRRNDNEKTAYHKLRETGFFNTEHTRFCVAVKQAYDQRGPQPSAKITDEKFPPLLLAGLEPSARDSHPALSTSFCIRRLQK